MSHPLRSGVRVAIAGLLAAAVLAAPALAAGSSDGAQPASLTMRKAGGERPDFAAVRTQGGDQGESIIAVLRPQA